MLPCQQRSSSCSCSCCCCSDCCYWPSLQCHCIGRSSNSNSSSRAKRPPTTLAKARWWTKTGHFDFRKLYRKPLFLRFVVVVAAATAVVIAAQSCLLTGITINVSTAAAATAACAQLTGSKWQHILKLDNWKGSRTKLANWLWVMM